MFDISSNKNNSYIRDFYKKIFKKFKKKKEGKIIYKGIRCFLYLFIFVFFALLIKFIVYSYTVKIIYQSAQRGKDYLEYAVGSLQDEEINHAYTLSNAAEENFISAAREFEEIKENFFIKNIESLSQEAENVDKLLQAAVNLSGAVKKGANFAKEFEKTLDSGNKITFSKFTIEEKQKMLYFLSSGTAEFEKINGLLDLALADLNNIKYEGYFKQYREKIEEVKVRIKDVKDMIVKANPLVKLLPHLLGYPKQTNYLILLQNNDELRPTGGFLGTFSVMQVKDGEILDCQTQDVYHLDMPIKDKLDIKPPEPLREYLGMEKWFMRDANWSPDWPNSARKIEWFYRNENRLLEKNKFFDDEFDAIAAINPKIVEDFLAITGPVVVEGQEYNKDNFKKLLQYRVEKGYVRLGVPSWHRKEVISQIYKELKIKIFDLPASRWTEVIDLIDDNIDKKNILVYLKDRDCQAIVKDRGFAGELKDTNGDYLMVVDANMASYKTDAVMDKAISYKVDQSDLDTLMGKVKIDYTHNGGFDWRTTRYRTYTRVYVPKGSKLIKSDGENVKAYDELGKTCFASFLSIEPGDSGSLYFEYKLPEKIVQDDKYQLYIQKQPGNNVGELKVDLNFFNETISFFPEEGKNLQWVSDLEVDRQFTARF